MDNNGVGQVSNDNPLSGRILRNRVGGKSFHLLLVATNCNQLQPIAKRIKKRPFSGRLFFKYNYTTETLESL